MSNKIWVLTYTIGTNEGRKSRRLICDTKEQAEMQQRVLGGEVVEYIRQPESFQVNWPEKMDVDAVLHKCAKCKTTRRRGKTCTFAATLSQCGIHSALYGRRTRNGRIASSVTSAR